MAFQKRLICGIIYWNNYLIWDIELIAPNQRGYSSQARPKDVKEYSIKSLAIEIGDLITFNDVTVPSQLIWGNKDMAPVRSGVELTKKYMKGPYRFIELNAGHWLMQESLLDVS